MFIKGGDTVFDCLRRAGLRGLFAWMLFGATMAPAVHAQDRMNDAVNRAAYLQMLPERITRSYAMLGQEVNPPRTKRQIEADLRAFDTHLAALRAMSLSPAQKQALAGVGENWAAFRAAATRAPDAVGAQALARANLELGRASAAVTASLRGSVTDRFDAIGLAGSVRTLSQRMARLYFYATWNQQVPEGASNLPALEKEVLSALEKLEIAPQNDESTLADLKLAQSQWVFFSRALARLGTGEARIQYMGEVAKSSDAVLEVLDGLTVKYAASKEQDWAN
jgi:hypothetical protein